MAFNASFPVDSQSSTYLGSLFHLEFSAFFRFLIFFLTGTSALTGKKERSHKDSSENQKTKISQQPTKKPYNQVLFQKPSAFLCENQYLDSVMVAFILQTVPEESSPETEGENTEIVGKLSESACTGLEWCDCPGLALSVQWMLDAVAKDTDILYQTAPDTM